jgi:uncharacterized protein YegL
MPGRTTSDRVSVRQVGSDPEPLMPGGGVARRPLHFIIMADCSGSMTGERIQALNYAIADMLPQLAEWERDQVVAQVLVRVLSFATVPHWHVREPVPVSELRWKALQAVEGGYTNMGPAFREVAAALQPDQLESRALRPAILLVTDGRPTDLGNDFRDGLDALTSFPAGRASLRLAIAIGQDAKSEFLDQFIGDPAVPVIVAGNTEEIADRLVAASIAVSRLSEGGADRHALVSQLLGSGSARPGEPEDETII